MVLYQEPNPGIVYRYVIPGNSPRSTHLTHNSVSNNGVEPGLQNRRIENGPTISDVTPSPYLSRRYRRRKFTWKATGYSECSKSCGGGVQTLRHLCIKEHTQQQVPEKRCHALERPREIRLRCNTRPCPPRWRGGPWSDCSTSCGSGVRTRELECVQEVKSSLTMRIADGACTDPRNLPTTEVCEMPACNEEIRPTPTQASSQTSAPRWTVGVWSQCSTSCGVGKKMRVVTCITQGAPCDLSEKPEIHETCDLGSCLAKPTPLNVISAKLQSPQWLFTEWSDQCSAECGTGVQTRRVLCETNSDDEYCDESNRPETSRDCLSNRTCSGQWFTGPWTECSSSCDLGEQVRDVVCVTTLRGSLRVVLDMNCPANKPETRKPCRERPCTSTWFISDWTSCSRSCGKGTQKREVRCLNPDGQLPNSHEVHCREDDRPVSRRTCNDYPCKDDLRASENSHRVLQVQDDPEITNGVESNPFCKDKIANCNLVTQARLCSYQFYQESCCLSCSRIKQDLE
ncbi:thrombospondin type-1 domain-containing protein 4 isoform X2 [Linepithema humile]